MFQTIEERFVRLKQRLPTREEREYYLRQRAKFGTDTRKLHSDIKLGKITSIKLLILQETLTQQYLETEDQTIPNLFMRGMRAHTTYNSLDEFDVKASYDEVIQVFDFIERALDLIVFT